MDHNPVPVRPTNAFTHTGLVVPLPDKVYSKSGRVKFEQSIRVLKSGWIHGPGWGKWPCGGEELVTRFLVVLSNF